MHLQSSTLKDDENGKPFTCSRPNRFARTAKPGRGRSRADAAGVGQPQHLRTRRRPGPGLFRLRQQRRGFDRLHRCQTRAIFGRSYAAEPDALVEQLRGDEGIAEADTLLLTVPNQLGVEYNAHVIESILKHVAPALGWR
jgi:hypothetical protein